MPDVKRWCSVSEIAVVHNGEILKNEFITAIVPIPIGAYAQHTGDASGMLNGLDGTENLNFTGCNIRGRSEMQKGTDTSELARDGADCAANAKKDIHGVANPTRRLLAKKPKALAIVKEWYAEWLAALGQIPVSTRGEQNTTDRLDRILARATAEAEW